MTTTIDTAQVSEQAAEAAVEALTANRAELRLVIAGSVDDGKSTLVGRLLHDTDSLPPYPVLDAILKQLIEGERLGEEERASVASAFAAQQSSAEGRALIARIKRMIARNEYKRRQAPPILRLRGRAFGSGRQMPIAAHYDFQG